MPETKARNLRKSDKETKKSNNHNQAGSEQESEQHPNIVHSLSGYSLLGDVLKYNPKEGYFFFSSSLDSANLFIKFIPDSIVDAIPVTIAF